MSAPSGHYANLADLVASEQGVDTSPEFELADPTQLVTWRSQELQPPSAQYVGVNDVLRLVLSCFLSNVNVALSVRLLRPDGTISYIQNVFAPANSTNQQSFDTQLAEGFLLSVNASLSLGNVLRGNVFLQVRLVQAMQGTAFAWSTLISDYLTSTASLAWPGGDLRSALDGAGALQNQGRAAPAAGADWTITTQPNTRSHLRHLRASLTTSAAVGNRQVIFTIGALAQPSYRVAAAATQGPSTTVGYSLGIGVPSLAPVAGEALLPLPQEVVISGNGTISVQTTGLDVADQWSVQVPAFEQWVEG